MDDQDRAIVIVALCILAAVAFCAFLLILCDPLLFRYDDDDEDDENENEDAEKYLPRWSVEYPEQEAYLQQRQEYQQQHQAYMEQQQQVYEQERQAYNQQQQQLYEHQQKAYLQQQQQMVEYDQPPEQEQQSKEAPKQKDPSSQTQPRASQNEQQQAVQAIPEEMESSVSSSSAESVTHLSLVVFNAEENFNSNGKDVNRQLEPYTAADSQSLPAVDGLVPYDESEVVDDAPFRKEESEEFQSESNEEEEEKVEVQPYSPSDSKATNNLPDELKNFRIGHSMSEAEEPMSPLTATGPELKAAPLATFPAQKQAAPVSPLKKVPPREMVPPPKQPVKRPQQPTRVRSLKTMIPRYSHKAERQRFIILNALIIVIIASITTVLVLRFYV